MGEQGSEQKLAHAQAEARRLADENKALVASKKELTNRLAEFDVPGSAGSEDLAHQLRVAEESLEAERARNNELKARVSELEGT